jgi:dTDP-4-amino-4,6-dideoxygalactose transaminase
VHEGDLGLDPAAAAAAVTERTRAIVAVHYGGGAADLDSLERLAADAGVLLIEDAAQALHAGYRGRAPGSIGVLGTLSFHETKNIGCGEGGALLVNDPALVERAEILQEKGTDRMRFVRGEVRAYTWVDVGSSYLLSELAAAILQTQLESGPAITVARRAIWQAYHDAFAPLEESGRVQRPAFLPGVEHNGHIYWLLVADRATRDGLIASLAAHDVRAYFHYVPLHSSPAGLRYGRAAGPLPVTDDAGARLVRLPLWVGMTSGDVERVAELVGEALS